MKLKTIDFKIHADALERMMKSQGVNANDVIDQIAVQTLKSYGVIDKDVLDLKLLKFIELSSRYRMDTRTYTIDITYGIPNRVLNLTAHEEVHICVCGCFNKDHSFTGGGCKSHKDCSIYRCSWPHH